MFNGSFLLRAADGHVVAPNIMLHENGSVTGFAEKNEIVWELESDILSFHFVTIAGKSLFVRFDQTWELRPGVSFRVGKFHFHGKRPSIATLMPQVGLSNHSFRRCHITTNLRGRSKTLLITFNGTGNLAQGRDTRWEFYELPFIANLDHIRIAEAPPVHWYLDQTKHILSTLIGCISTAYDKVILCGMSSGAYASMYFAETMAIRFPNVTFLTYAINPQTVHQANQRQHVVKQFPGNMRPAVISDEAFGNRDCTITELDEVIGDATKREIVNVHHNVYYDSGNPCEVFYSGILTSQRRVTLHPLELGQSHGDGCAKIFHMNLVQQAVLREAYY